MGDVQLTHIHNKRVKVAATHYSRGALRQGPGKNIRKGQKEDDLLDFPIDKKGKKRSHEKKLGKSQV